MTRTDVELELMQFTNGFKRIYRYKQEFIPDHYVTVIKTSKVNKDGSSEEDFSLLLTESTTEIEDFDKELFIKLLTKEELKFNIDGKWFSEITDLRTDSCICGAWATLNSTSHAFWCRKSIAWGAGNE